MGSKAREGAVLCVTMLTRSTNCKRHSVSLSGWLIGRNHLRVVHGEKGGRSLLLGSSHFLFPIGGGLHSPVMSSGPWQRPGSWAMCLAGVFHPGPKARGN